MKEIEQQKKSTLTNERDKKALYPSIRELLGEEICEMMVEEGLKDILDEHLNPREFFRRLMRHCISPRLEGKLLLYTDRQMHKAIKNPNEFSSAQIIFYCVLNMLIWSY